MANTQKKVLASYGFSLIELILVTALMLIVFSSGGVAFSKIHRTVLINDDTGQLIELLRSAREKSIAGLNNATHGVYIDKTNPEHITLILYQGNDFSNRNTNFDQKINLNSSTSVNTTLAGNDINFSSGTGYPDHFGIITVSNQDNDQNSITINKYGLIKQN